MNFQLKGDFTHVLDGITALQADYNFTVSDTADISLTCEQQVDQDGLRIIHRDGEGHITYQKTHHFFRALGIWLEKVEQGRKDFSVEETPQFNSVGPMFDLSRNSVLKMEAFQELLRKLAMMGFDSAMLYMEDTYEVKTEPYFGYMRRSEERRVGKECGARWWAGRCRVKQDVEWMEAER